MYMRLCSRSRFDLIVWDFNYIILFIYFVVGRIIVDGVVVCKVIGNIVVLVVVIVFVIVLVLLVVIVVVIIDIVIVVVTFSIKM